jgi:hypothetical protein
MANAVACRAPTQRVSSRNVCDVQEFTSAFAVTVLLLATSAASLAALTQTFANVAEQRSFRTALRQDAVCCGARACRSLGQTARPGLPGAQAWRIKREAAAPMPSQRPPVPADTKGRSVARRRQSHAPLTSWPAPPCARPPRRPPPTPRTRPRRLGSRSACGGGTGAPEGCNPSHCTSISGPFLRLHAGTGTGAWLAFRLPVSHEPKRRRRRRGERARRRAASPPTARVSTGHASESRCLESGYDAPRARASNLSLTHQSFSGR